MKKFPAFSDADIMLKLKQPQYKFLFLSLSFLLYKLEQGLTLDELQPIIAYAQTQYGFKFTQDAVTGIDVIHDHMGFLSDEIIDAYMAVKSSYIDNALSDLTDYATQNLDSEILQLSPGDRLSVGFGL